MMNFNAGDTILFEGGKTFNGGIALTSEDKGTARNPIVIASYGNKKATINANGGLFSSGLGFQIYNTQGIEIRNLVIKGPGRTSSQTSIGINIYMDMARTRLSHIVVDDVEVSDFPYHGISIGSGSKTGGFDDISITNTSVHDIGDAGITSYADDVIAHRNIYVGYSKVFNISGLAAKSNSHSGSGIMLGGVDGGIVEYCEAYNNGWLNAWKSGGPVGIWGYYSNNLVIQHNESHHNYTGTTKDGGGFDLDGGCTNSIMQYNYSHDNDGAGYLLAQYSGAPAMKNIIVRYNISENDGRKNDYAGIQLWSTGSNGGIQNAEIYNNTVFVSPSKNGSPKAIYVQSGGISNATVRNNIFQTTGDLQVVRVQSNADIRFEGNNYWAEKGNVEIYWTGRTYTNLEDWRKTTNQEEVNGISTGLMADPEFESYNAGITLSDPAKLKTLKSYKLKATSNLVAKGLDLKAKFKTDIGEIDFWGNSLNQLKEVSIGAFQGIKSSNNVKKNSQSITFESISDKASNDVPFKLEASASSGLPISYNIISGPATVSGDKLTITGTGKVEVEASQSGNDNFYAATPVKQTFKVKKASKTEESPAQDVSLSCSATGTILREQWDNVKDSEVSASNFNGSPSSSNMLTSFEAESNKRDFYAARISGYICPPQTGDYTFWVAGDNNAELWLSTDDNPNNKVKIAYTKDWTNARQWDKYASQKSKPVRLEAGKRYYVEALQQEEWGGDNLAVAWQMPDGSKEAPIAGSHLSPFQVNTLSTSSTSKALVVQPQENLTSSNDELTVYPNPLSDRATVGFVLQENAQTTLEVYDLSGKLVQKLFNGIVKAGEPLELTLKANDLRPGLYLVKMKSNNRIITKKIIKSAY
ncbi:PA14 domain-containing protein [Pontibacter silvestris]|uniref:PA14 domain-containing protein n=5 Tax=Pontibacter silvestris TaxID=2305183 RepID=A0ABW4WWN2_9BACT